VIGTKQVREVHFSLLNPKKLKCSDHHKFTYKKESSLGETKHAHFLS
jgi:hypothetical protein